MIYFDNAATTPVHLEVADLIHRVLVEDWGNPSSLHRKGLEAERIMEQARESIADYLSVDSRCIYFTSSATEANNIAIRSAIRRKRGANIVISSIEHSSIFSFSKTFREEGIEVRLLPVDSLGRINPDDLVNLVDKDTALVALMQVNNELGTIEPVEEVARLTKRINPFCLFLVDGVQGFTKIPLALTDSPIDYYTASGHKIHAPKGIGFLYVKRESPVQGLLTGGGQEKGIRPGTENVAYIAGLAKAVDLVATCDESLIADLNRGARERLTSLEDHIINSPEDASPYILNFAARGVKSEVVLHMMEQEEMYLSTGSACAGGALSHVLQAIHLPEDYLEGGFRLSFQSQNRLEELDPFFDRLFASIRRVRSIQAQSGRR